jgi:two-component system, cell cycle sensor histidine kinase and response regulator CckA
MLRSLGFTPITAADGREALMLLLENPDLRFVLLDLTMPNMDGAECFRELRKVAPTLKIILASGYSEQDITHRFLGTGLAGFIQKPYTFASLRTVIRSALA